MEALTTADGGADINARNSQGASALALAAEAGQTEAVDVLLRRGADTALRTSKEKTALEIAEERGLVNVEHHYFEVAALLSRVSVAEYLAQLSQGDKDRRLTKAAANGHAESARLLVEAGANTTFRDENEKAALEIAETPREKQSWESDDKFAARTEGCAEVAALLRQRAATQGTDGTIAPLLERGWTVPTRRAATICSSALRAAQLRLLLGFLHSDRLTEHCPLALEAGRVTETIAACFRVRDPLTLSQSPC